MEKIECGMYVRTKQGIAKIIEIFDKDNEPYDEAKYRTDTFLEIYYDSEYIGDEDIIGEPSYNIIDLIKSKDIILGKDGKLYQCWKVYKDYVFTYSKNKQGQTITLVDYQIDKVMCYEQFENMSYKVGD